MRQGLPLTQKASENSNKSSPPSPPCVRRKEVGFPDVQLYQVTTCERPPCSPQRGHSPIMWVLMGSRPTPHGLCPPGQLGPGGRPGLWLCQTHSCQLAQPCMVAMAILHYVSGACCSPIIISLWGQSHFREALGATRQRGGSQRPSRVLGPGQALTPAEGWWGGG